MAWYTSTFNAARNHPLTTVVLLGIGASFGSYFYGKHDALNQPLVESVKLLKDYDQDQKAPDVSIQLLNGRREAGFMQEDGTTILTYQGMLKRYGELNAVLNSPTKAERTSQARPNPLDNPFVIPQTSQPAPAQQAPPSGPALIRPNAYNPTSQANLPSNSELETIASTDAQPDSSGLVPVTIQR